ncbi:MAG: RecQ family ATP-dependent DNA helicase [Chloroflexota bacterium]
MTDILRGQARALLRRALDDPSAEFREWQWEAIERLIQGRAKLLVVQRTGWGKSVVYFLATRLLRDQGAGPTLLLSPLLALMRNQMAMAERLGVHAATINSSNRSEWEQVKTEVLADRVDILLISPERLANDEFRESILLPIAERVGLFVVDEGHCISDWGHDFRPDYRRIVRVLQALPPNIPALVTTATANDRVVQDIVDQLGHNLQVIRGPLGRSSLRLQNIYLGNQAARMAWLVEHLPSMPGSGVIYTLTIKDAQRLAAWLQSQGISAYSYWGRLNSEDRIRLENQLLNNEVKALVATTALGMGFDKPDLGFVIHFQRPGSVIHYYQQVGRAGRAIDQAYGILLSGDEDQEITDYFIRAAFPPEGHAEQVLDALSLAEDGLLVRMLEERVNLAQGQIQKVLKLLAVETPSPVSRRGSRWYRNPVPYVPDREKIERLTLIRKQEQRKMLEYTHSQDCLMAFLQRELDDPKPVPCGRCAVCLGKPLLPETCSTAVASQAAQFLHRTDQVIVPRKMWVVRPGRIPEHLRAEEGRSLCLWGDAGWGELVKRGKQVDGRFDQRLVLGAAEMIRKRWKPEPFPLWVTCVPSLNHPTLVPDFARRLAQQLGLRFVECVQKVRQTEPQKLMNNSYQQARNLKGAFVVEPWAGIGGPVLLVDDMVDARWTLTAIAALLRHADSGPVYPMALADTSRTG